LLIRVMRILPKWLGCLGFLLLLGLVTAGAKEADYRGAKVAVLRTGSWPEGDAVREGAAEFVVLLEIARLRHEPGEIGLVAVGDRRGLFSTGAEEALRRAVLQGVPVVKLAAKGHVLPAPHGLFLDGGMLSEDEAQRMLAHCLEKFGALPVVASGRSESRLRELLQQYQNEFSLAAGLRLASR